MSQTDTTAAGAASAQAAPSALEVKDPRTQKAYPLTLLERGTEGDEAIRASDLRQVKVDAGDFGMMSYDPAFMNTASCKSAITYIDGDKGILRYRGYPIEQLAEKSTFLEVAYLLRNGELPTQDEYNGWVHDITHHTYVHENIKKFIESAVATSGSATRVIASVSHAASSATVSSSHSVARSAPTHPSSPAPAPAQHTTAEGASRQSCSRHRVTP